MTVTRTQKNFIHRPVHAPDAHFQMGLMRNSLRMQLPNQANWIRGVVVHLLAVYQDNTLNDFYKCPPTHRTKWERIRATPTKEERTMLVIKIELWSARTGEETELGRMYIANDGTGTAKRGNFDAKICHKGSFEYRGWDEVPVTRSARVEDYPRLSYNVWRLVLRALRAAFPEEKK